MKNEMTDKIFKNFLQGRYSYDDYLKVKSFFDKIHDQKKIKELLYLHWNELNKQHLSGEKSLKYIYEKIEYRILMEEKKELQNRRLWNSFYRAAAFLLLPVLAFSLWCIFFIANNTPPTEGNFSSVEIYALVSSRTKFTLPDGSTGWLNSGSKLRYNPDFSQSREVELTGEAYFEVIPGEFVFTVSVADLSVQVFGTSFNVSAYPEDKISEVVLVSGKLKVQGKTNYFNRTLTPEHKLTYRPEKKSYRVRKVDTTPYTAWKDGFLLLDNEPLEQAVNRIERWYNADILIEDQTLKNYRFKATFLDEPLEEVLKLLAVSTPINYYIEKRVAGPDSLFQKRKVILKLKK
jgi:transmembrane sensor